MIIVRVYLRNVADRSGLDADIGDLTGSRQRGHLVFDQE